MMPSTSTQSGETPDIDRLTIKRVIEWTQFTQQYGIRHLVKARGWEIVDLYTIADAMLEIETA